MPADAGRPRRRAAYERRRRESARTLAAQQAEAAREVRRIEALIVGQVAALAHTLKPTRGHPVIKIADHRIGGTCYF